MKKPLTLLAVMMLAGIFASSCGGGGGGEQDTTTDDTAVTDQTDQATDTPGDRPGDVPAEETPGEVVPDGEPDVVPDAQPDAVPDVEPDGELPPSQCVENGGYCTTYAITATPCVLCPDVDDTHYKPSRPADDAMGCTVEGVGAGPWCCVLADTGDPTACESGGGECYPGGGDCPIGWIENNTLRCHGSQRCCAPGEDCPST
jgi:hypothetical protein